jgi:predicted AAA+ superfamily ATPase
MRTALCCALLLIPDVSSAQDMIAVDWNGSLHSLDSATGASTPVSAGLFTLNSMARGAGAAEWGVGSGRGRDRSLDFLPPSPPRAEPASGTTWSIRAEVPPSRLDRLWLRGGFPRSFLARNDAASGLWREEFVQTFLERDLAQFGFRTPAATMRRFWSMVAHCHGQIWNASEFGRSLGQSDHAARRHLEAMASTFVVRVLQPFHANLGKRQVKSPKIYVADSGLLHTLLGVPNLDTLRGHAKVGASFEGFALTTIVEHLRARPHECYYWATHGGAELDLLIERGGRRIGFEFKLGSAPSLTPSMRTAMVDLELERLWVVHAGKEVIKLAPSITALPLALVANTQLD